MRIRFALFVSLLLLSFASLPISTPAVAAQDDRVKAIPIPGVYSQIRLSPAGRTAAAFEIGIIHNDEVFPEYLPVRLIDLVTGEITHELNGHTDYANEVAFSSDGSRIMTYHDNGDMFIWDAMTGDMIQRITAFAAILTRAQFYPDSPLMVMTCGGNTRQLCEWDSETGYLTRILRPYYETRLDYMAQFGSTPPPIYTVLDVSSDGETIAAVTSYGSIDLWDVMSGAMTTINEPTEFPTFNITSIAFTADDSQVVFYDNETENVHVLDVATGREVAAFSAGYAGTPYFALAPDGDRFAWVGGESESPIITISSISESRDPLSIPLLLPEGLEAQTRQVNLFFTPDGEALIVGGFMNMDGEPDGNVIYVIDLSS